jgi:hypothetical protein
MSRTRLIRYLSASVVGFIALGCADYATSPTATIQPPSNTVYSRSLNGASVSAVRWNGNRASGDQTSGTIGPNGGTLSIPDADFTITFSPGALKSATVITITANSDGYVGYEMLPHGLTFSAPVTVTQGLHHTAKSDGVFCVYLKTGGVAGDGSANGDEIETSTTSYGPNGRADSQTWTLNHFSRYILASGVTSDSDGSAPPAGN